MRILANIFVDFLIWSSGTWVGAPQEKKTVGEKPDSECGPASNDGAADED